MPTDTPFKERPGRLPTAREIIDGKSDEFTRLALGEDLTMPNPVAEVVARLRRDAYAPHFTSVGAANLMIEAADLIERLSRERDTALAIERDPTSSERVCALMDAQYMAGAKAGWNASQSEDPEAAYAALGKSRDGYVKVLIETRSPAVSRERDTGVPEGIPDEPVRVRLDSSEMKFGECDFCYQRSNLGRDARGDLMCGSCADANYLGEMTAYARQLRAMLSAAPQPPTVSTQGWQDISTAPRDGRWFLICREDEGPESYEVGCFDPQTWSAYEPAENGLYRKVERVVNEWRGFNNFHRATHWTALLGHPGDPDLSTTDDPVIGECWL